MALRARIMRMWMEMHLIFLYIYIILAVAVFNNKFNNLHFWTRVPSGQASGMRQARARVLVGPGPLIPGPALRYPALPGPAQHYRQHRREIYWVAGIWPYTAVC